MPFTALFFGGLFFIGILIFSIWQTTKRRKEWQEFALAHNLAFSGSDIYNLPSMYFYFDMFKHGHSKTAYNLCYGNDKGFDIITCDYRYTTGSGKNKQTHFRTALIIKTTMMFKEISLRPENFFDKIGAAIGFDDIDFESAEFSKKYYVTAADKKFAYDIIHPRMMELLLSNTGICMQANANSIIFHRGGTLTISQMELLIMFSHKFMELIPDYLRKEIEMNGRGN
jgi:hypothetical protein